MSDIYNISKIKKGMTTTVVVCKETGALLPLNFLLSFTFVFLHPLPRKYAYELNIHACPTVLSVGLPSTLLWFGLQYCLALKKSNKYLCTIFLL